MWMASMKQSCGAIIAADGAMEWRVWAPKATNVDLILIDGIHRHREAMTPQPYGYFLFRRDAVSDGQRYAFSLDQGPDRADPASRWQPDGVAPCSAVVLPARFEWSDGNWH